MKSALVVDATPGARSVMALYQSPMTVGLFQRAIAMSPGCLATNLSVSFVNAEVKYTISAKDIQNRCDPMRPFPF